MKNYLFSIFFIVFLMMVITPAHAQLRRVKQDTYVYYSLGNQHFSKTELSKFLKNNCPAAYEEYHNKYLKIGWGICVPSMAMLVGGAVMSFSGAADPILYTGIGLGAAGAVGILSSMFVLSRGYEIRRNTCSVYNSQCGKYASATPMILNLNAGPQSLGISLIF